MALICCKCLVCSQLWSSLQHLFPPDVQMSDWLRGIFNFFFFFFTRISQKITVICFSLFKAVENSSSATLALEIKSGWGQLVQGLENFWPSGWVGNYYTITPRHQGPPSTTHTERNMQTQGIRWPSNLWNCTNFPSLLCTHQAKHAGAFCCVLLFHENKSDIESPGSTVIVLFLFLTSEPRKKELCVGNNNKSSQFGEVGV